MGQRSYTAEYRANAAALAKEMGANAAALQLKIPADTLYTCISRAKKGDLPTPPDPKASLNLAKRAKDLERERENKALRNENAQIRRENQISEEATVFFAARRKKSGSV
jgi:transposase-like protein